MRISDWSSDVCSSDLSARIPPSSPLGARRTSSTSRPRSSQKIVPYRCGLAGFGGFTGKVSGAPVTRPSHSFASGQRSEEHRLDKGGARTCSYLWTQYHLEKNKIIHESKKKMNT